MSAADKIFGAFKAAISSTEHLSETDRAGLLAALETEIAKEPPPVLAIIGEAGVGKSATLNALFNAGATLAAVGHSKATTKNADGFDVAIFDHQGNRGDIRVLDLPGLGESRQSAARLADLYASALPQADAILWVHPANDRMLEFTQTKLVELFQGKLRAYVNNLVFGLNKADDMHPKDWRYHANVPSDAQMANLQGAEENFSFLIANALPEGSAIRVTTYSATQRYNLSRLFRMMMQAVPERRRWVLESRMDVANFLELADTSYIQNLRAKGLDVSVAQTPPRDKIIEMMSEKDMRDCLRNHITPEAWWQQRSR
jgi:predicted GTPase